VSVYKPAKGRYWLYDFVQQRHRFYGSTGQTTRRKAEDVERAKRFAAATGELTRSSIPTLDLAAQEWWEAKGRALKSAPDIEARLALCLKLIGRGKLVNEITTADVADAIRRRRGILTRGRTVASNATVNRDIIDTLRPVLKRAGKLLVKQSMPVIDWAELRLPEPRPKPKDFTTAEMASAYDATPEHLKEFAWFQAFYGCRIGEMFFHPDAVDVEGRRVTLRDRKGDDDHILPLTDDDAAMLAARVGRAKAAGLKTVWYRERKGRLKPVTYRSALDALRKVMTATGLRASKGARGSHALRHHAGMQMLRDTGNLRMTQKLLGHASIQSTLVYAHAMEADLRAALAARPRHSPEQLTTDDEEADTIQKVSGS